jgi:hypothetical protein
MAQEAEDRELNGSARPSKGFSRERAPDGPTDLTQQSRRMDSNPRPPLYEGDLGPGTEDA